MKLTPEQRTQLEQAKGSQRADAIKLLDQDFTVSEVADKLGVHPNTIYTWIRRFKADGVGGLQDKPRSGRPQKVDQPYRDTLQRLIEEQAAGWSVEQIRDEMQRLTGTFISAGYLRQILRQMGYSPGWTH